MTRDARALYDALRVLRQKATTARKAKGEPYSQRAVEKALAHPRYDHPDFNGQRISAWIPEEFDKAQVPAEGSEQSVWQLVRLWSDWAGETPDQRAWLDLISRAQRSRCRPGRPTAPRNRPGGHGAYGAYGAYGDVFDRLDDVPFTDRPWLTDRIDAFAAGRPRGYFFVEGGTGVGKTTLIARLAADRGHPHHFTAGHGSRRRTEDALRSLGEQLVARFGLDDLGNPGGLGDLGGLVRAGHPVAFRRVLGAAAEAARQRGEKAILLVDGLELADEHRPMPLGLPDELPDNVYVIATLADGFPLHGRKPPWDHVHIDAHAEQSLDDMRRHIDRALESDKGLREWIRPMPPAEFRQVLARHCAGLWILLRHLLDELRAEKIRPEALPTLPGRLWTHYSRKLDELTPEELDLALPALSTLACAEEPLPLDTVVALAGIEDTARHRRELRAMVAGRLQQFVVTEGDREAPRYAPDHDSVRDYFKGRLPDRTMTGDEPRLDLLRDTVDQARHRIVDRYVLALFGTWDAFPRALAAHPAELGGMDGGYGLRNLARHLETAGETETLHRLLAAEAVLPGDGSGAPANIWFTAHERHDSLGAYRNDVARARRLAAGATDDDVARGRRATSIGREVRYALMDAGVASIVRASDANVTQAVLRRLVEERVWDPAKALDRVEAVRDPRTRVNLLAALVRARRDSGVPCLSGEDAVAAWDLLQPLDTLRAHTVAGELLPRLPEPRRAAITAERLRLGLDPSTPVRTPLLGTLAGCLGEADLDTAVDAVLAAGDDERCTAAALTAMLPHVSRAALERILRAVGDRPPQTPRWGRVHRALALRLAAENRHPDRVAGHVTAELFALMHDGLGLVTVTAARPAPDTGPLRTLLSALDTSRRTQVLDTVLDRIAEQRHWGITGMLAEIGGFLSGPPVDRALATARSVSPVHHPGARAGALAALLPAVPEQHRPDLAAEVLRSLPARGSGDDHRRGETLCALAGHVDEEHTDRVEELVRDLEEADRAEPLVLLAGRRPGHAGVRLREEALAIAAGHHGWRRADIIIKVAPHLDHRTRLRAFELVAGIGHAKAAQAYRDAALDALAVAAGHEEELRHALRAAGRIHDRLPQAAALAALAGQVPTGERPRLRRRVEELLASLAPPDRADPLITLAAALPAREHDEVLRRAADLVPAGREPGDHGFLDRLRAVRRVLTDQEIRDRLVDAAHWSPGRGWEGLDVWAVLAPPGRTDHRLLKKPEKAVRKRLRRGGEHETAQCLALLAPHVSAKAVAALTAAAEQRHEVVRALPLAALAHRLTGPDRARVIRQVLTDLRADTAMDGHAVGALAHELTEPERDELLDVVLPRLERAQWPYDLLARTLPSLSERQRARALAAGAVLLPGRLTLPGEDFTAVAAHADQSFLRVLVEEARYRSDAHRPHVVAAALASPSAAPHAVSWNKGTANGLAPVRDLLGDLTRPGLLAVVQAAAPHVGHHGGMAAAQECVSAIEDVARWWP
ncbi:ATP-binding protein [Streptomyces longispororuber]|uniref:ATP-binding protein n=1 Tax=Streptomyces longispororuber TaxID=68230 RepID=UPI0033C4BE0D